MSAAHPCRQLGFTLIELMVTIAVMLILLALAVPSFRGVIAGTKMTSGANSLIAHLQYARTEAVKRGTEITVCPSQAGAACDNSTDWTGGYIVAVHDVTVRDCRAVTTVLRRVNGDEMASIVVTKNGGTPCFQFSADGSADGYQATLKLCDPTNAAVIRQVVVSGTGRAYVQCNDPNAYTCADTCP